MCQREGVSLQRGMNFALRDNHSVILMSVRPNAPYSDRLEDDGTTLIYEGHDVPRSPQSSNPKTFDQPSHTPTGSLTQNGLFHRAAQLFKSGEQQPERVRVYEKIKQGIWPYNGIFLLMDSWQKSSEGRQVFKFKLVAVEGEEDFSVPVPSQSKPRRIIPTWVKLGYGSGTAASAQCAVLTETCISITSYHGRREVHPRRQTIFNSFAGSITSRNTIELNKWPIGSGGLPPSPHTTRHAGPHWAVHRACRAAAGL
jgi:hypothetical protein